jgi:hypothetical protein
MKTNIEKIESIQEQIAALKKHWPAHSVPPGLMQQLDELEEALAQAMQENVGPKNREA